MKKTIEDYIVVKNTISKELCQSLIDENNKIEWVKHAWYNNQKDTKSTHETKETRRLWLERLLGVLAAINRSATNVIINHTRTTISIMWDFILLIILMFGVAWLLVKWV